MKKVKTNSQTQGLSIKNKILLAFSVILLLMVFISANSLFRLNEAKDKISKIVTEDYPTTALGNNVIREVNNATTLLLNAIIEKEPERKDQLLQALNAKSKDVTALYEQLKEKADDEPSQLLLNKISEFRSAYIQSRALVIKNLKTDPEAAVSEYTTHTRAYESQYQGKIMEFIDLQRNEMQTSYTGFLGDYAVSKATMIVVSLICLALGIIMAILISRAIVRPINHAVSAGILTGAIAHMQQELRKIVTEIRSGAENIATGASQIMAGTRDLSARTEEQASSVEQTAASMEQISVTVKNTGSNTANASLLSENASITAKDNEKLMSSLTHEIHNITNSADKMSDIISLIDSIAFQTNILALNAAVEAARAGEHGKGFAVVAQEVRVLAQKTANSSKDIRSLIENSMQQSSRGLDMVRQVSGKMDGLVQNVDSVSNILKEIEQASLEQSEGVHQINIAIGQIVTTTQQNAALVEESVAASEMLNEQARVLKDLVSVFKMA